MAGRKIGSAEEARRFLAQVEDSGLERAVWARQNNVDARSLNAWRLNLERAARSSSLRLVELVPARCAPRPAKYRIECGPFAVEVDEHFDEGVLGRLLAVVARC